MKGNLNSDKVADCKQVHTSHWLTHHLSYPLNQCVNLIQTIHTIELQLRLVQDLMLRNASHSSTGSRKSLALPMSTLVVVDYK